MTRQFLAVACVALGTASLLTAHATRVTRAEAGEDATASSPVPALSQAAIRHADIEFYQARVAGDPSGAADRMRLGALLLDRARASGAERDLVKAEALARESLTLRRAHNSAAWHLLAAVLLGQHRFLEALDAADELVSAAPESEGARALRGEVLLELGRYPAADSVFASLRLQRMELNVAPRYARWLEVRGRSGEARRLLEQSLITAREQDVPEDQILWYHLRLGELHLRHGRHRAARRWLDSGLDLRPSDWRLLGARARLALGEGDPRLAISMGDSSLGFQLDPAMLALVGDAFLRLDQPETAESYFRALEAAAGSAPAGGFHRSWYLALLDHDRMVPDIRARVTREIETRPDIHGWDLLAWALHKSGRTAAARAAMTKALAFGTDDPLIERHARLIGAAP